MNNTDRTIYLRWVALGAMSLQVQLHPEKNMKSMEEEAKVVFFPGVAAKLSGNRIQSSCCQAATTSAAFLFKPQRHSKELSENAAASRYQPLKALLSGCKHGVETKAGQIHQGFLPGPHPWQYTENLMHKHPYQQRTNNKNLLNKSLYIAIL